MQYLFFSSIKFFCMFIILSVCLMVSLYSFCFLITSVMFVCAFLSLTSVSLFHNSVYFIFTSRWLFGQCFISFAKQSVYIVFVFLSSLDI